MTVAVIVDTTSDPIESKMKTLFILLTLAFGINASQYCYNKVQQDCSSHTSAVSCNSAYGNYANVQGLWNDLFKNYLMRSNEYLLLKVNFDNYQFARPGFAQLFDQLSDKKFNTAIRMMRFMTQRNGVVEFGQGNAYTNGNYELYEVPALSLAVDMEKEFIIDTNEIHKIVTGPPAQHDADVAWYISYKFAFQQSGLLRQLVGYNTELTRMSTSIDVMVAIEQFDDFLAGEEV